MPSRKSALSSQMCTNAMFIQIYESHDWSEKTCIWRRGLFTIPWTKFAIPVWNFNDSEPLLSQVYVCVYVVQRSFTRSDNIANNFAWWILFLNWNAVCQVKQKSVVWKYYRRSRLMIPNHIFINPKRRQSRWLKPQPWPKLWSKRSRTQTWVFATPPWNN